MLSGGSRFPLAPIFFCAKSRAMVFSLLILNVGAPHGESVKGKGVFAVLGGGGNMYSVKRIRA